jgi:hypothetical protein
MIHIITKYEEARKIFFDFLKRNEKFDAISLIKPGCLMINENCKYEINLLSSRISPDETYKHINRSLDDDSLKMIDMTNFKFEGIEECNPGFIETNPEIY